MYSYNQILDICLEITKKRMSFMYKKPLKLSFYTINILFQKARERGLCDQDWLLGTTLYNSLNFALLSSQEVSKMSCNASKYRDMKCLAFVLKFNDDWKHGIEVVYATI